MFQRHNLNTCIFLSCRQFIFSMTCCRFAEELNEVLSPLLQFYFFCSQLIMCVVTFQVVLVSCVT